MSSPTNVKEEGTPPQPSPPAFKEQSHKERYTTRHTIGGHEYALTMWPPRWTWSRVLQSFVTVVTSPVWIPLSALYVAIQYASTRSFRGKLLTWILPRFMERVDETLHTERKVLLQHVSGRVLDVGAGSGTYFRYYTKADAVVAVEPAETLHPLLRQAADKYLYGKNNNDSFPLSGTWTTWILPCINLIGSFWVTSCAKSRVFPKL